jgi:hypothetical protein
MITTNSKVMTDSDWKVSFWFAVLSPVLGMLIGVLVLLLAVH